MVREKRARRPQPKGSGPVSVWDSPRIKEMRAEPLGSAAELTREEAIAIAREAFGTWKDWPDGAEYVRRVRKLSGALLIRPHD